MKKALILSAFACGAMGVQAQSSVTLFGVVDTTVQNVRGAGNGHVTRLVQGGNASSRLGFRGTEDLGGGMSASFWVEAGVATDSGAGAVTSTNNQASGASGGGGLTFNRRSTVSLAGRWGELRLGRDFAPSYLTLSAGDPFGNVGVGSNFNLLGALGTARGVPSTVRVSNSVGYLLPANLGGIYGNVMYAMGENPSNAAGGTSSDGRHVGARVGYRAGPFDISGAYGRTSFAAGDYVQADLAGSYDFGFLKLLAGVYREEVRAATAARADSWSVAATAPVGPGLLKASYTATNQNAGAGNNDANLLALGYVYNLSARTAVFTTISRIDNKGASVFYNQGRAASTPGGNTTGLDVGLRHAF